MRIDFEVIGLKETINLLENLAQNSESKADSVIDELAKIGKDSAQKGFQSVMLKDSKGASKTPDIVLSIENGYKERTIIADGTDAVYSEFGVGVQNYDLGLMPETLDGLLDKWGHHYSAATPAHLRNRGYSLGVLTSKSNKKGKPGWADKHGNAPSRAMYNASKTIEQEASRVVKEVFK